MTPVGGGKQPRLRSSHSRLLRKAGSPVTLDRPKPGWLNALIIPTSRPASSLDRLIALSARTGTLLVVICSKQAKADQVAARVARTPGARALLIDITEGYELDAQPTRTSAKQFHAASGHRKNDLSLKRNIGLLLARLCGWNKILFLDDDITLSRPEVITRFAAELDENQIAGMACREFPDNSVLCHARRLAGFTQDNFVSGAVLGVNCGDLPLPFFPDIYNEDWFFFSPAVARRELTHVGNAIQSPYEPFADPKRARGEEFGDLLAEGLYSLIGDANPELDYRQLLDCATEQFWTAFIDARWSSLLETREALEKFDHANWDDLAAHALRSLGAAEDQLLNVITPVLCQDFLDAWQLDLDDWERLTEGTNNIGGVTEAMAHLGLDQWRLAQFGDAQIETPATLDFLFGQAWSGGVSLSRSRRSNRSASVSKA